MSGGAERMQALVATATRPTKKATPKQSLHSQARASHGLTLVEVAIFLLLVGLLMMGVLRAEQLIENARVRKAIAQQDAVEQAVLASLRQIFIFSALSLRLPRASEAGCAGRTRMPSGQMLLVPMEIDASGATRLRATRLLAVAAPAAIPFCSPLTVLETLRIIVAPLAAEAQTA